MKLLELCGYEPNEIKKELPRVKKALEAYGISQEDIKVAEKRVEKFWDVELKGVRKLLGCQLRDWIDMILAPEEEKKIITCQIPSVGGMPVAAAVLERPHEVWGGFPKIANLHNLGAVFGKLPELLEAAENLCMTPGEIHCGCDMTEIGAYAMGRMGKRKPDLNITWACFCVEAPKVDGLIEDWFGVPTYYINRIQDDGFKETEVPQRIMDYVCAQIKGCQKVMSDTLGWEVTDEMMLKGMGAVMNCYMHWSEIAELLRADPMPLHQADMSLCDYIMFTGVQDLAGVAEALSILAEEVKERVKAGKGVLPKGAPRVMTATFTPISDPGIAHMIEEVGLAVGAVGFRLFDPDGSTKVQMSEKVNLLKWEETIANLYIQNMLYKGVPGKADLIVKGCEYWNLDGILWLNETPCRPFASDALMLKEFIQKKKDIPMLLMDSSIYDTRAYSAPQLRTRVESFAELLRLRMAK
jgi:benzoyl-CoA reductase/2-hydroxyglutaryl-CoA dehydratase subunit BcrC/BadD/HgdB